MTAHLQNLFVIIWRKKIQTFLKVILHNSNIKYQCTARVSRLTFFLEDQHVQQQETEQRKESMCRFSRQHSAEDNQLPSDVLARQRRRRSTISSVSSKISANFDAAKARRMSSVVEEPMELIKREEEKKGKVQKACQYNRDLHYMSTTYIVFYRYNSTSSTRTCEQVES